MGKTQKLKTRVAICLDKSLVTILKDKRTNLSSQINQLLWRELALENDKEHFVNFHNVVYENESWQFKKQENQIDQDFKFLYRIYLQNYEELDEWMNKHSPNYKKTMLYVLKKGFKINYKNFKESLNSGKYSAKYYSLAFRNIINFAVEKNLLKKSESIDIKEKLKLNKSDIDIRVPTKEEVIKLVAEIKKYNNDDYIFIRLLIESGLRVADGMYFLEVFSKDNIELRENIFICPLYHFRGSKSSFYLLATKETYDLLIENYDLMKNYNPEGLKTHIKRNKLLPLKYLRKYNFTLMIENDVNFEIANFIQGRASQNIGFNHYLAKKNLACREYLKIVATLKIIDNFHIN